MALENCPTEARGLMSGILQQGYSMGYVFAACANLGVGGAVETWKTVFWIAAGLSIGVGLIRCCFPESKQFLEAKKNGHKKAPGAFWKETKVMLAQQWKMCIYCIILMTWFNCKTRASYKDDWVLTSLQTTVTLLKTATPLSCLLRRV
jgi:MFS family permease